MVRLNDDKEMVKSIKEGLKRTGGYCPCRIQRTEENKCMCKEFREQTRILRASAIVCSITKAKTRKGAVKNVCKGHNKG